MKNTKNKAVTYKSIRIVGNDKIFPSYSKFHTQFIIPAKVLFNHINYSIR